VTEAGTGRSFPGIQINDNPDDRRRKAGYGRLGPWATLANLPPGW
jgi:hypothetical protein